MYRRLPSLPFLFILLECVLLVLSPAAARKEISVEYSLPPHVKLRPDNIKVLEYQSSCALMPNQSLVHREGKSKRVFKGELGLASEWVHRPLSEEEQRWVSACLMARTNYFGLPVRVLLTGGHPALAHGDSSNPERRGSLLEEGSFYGNLFSRNSQSKRYACSGRDADTGSGAFRTRVCALAGKTHQKNRCGFVYMGPCQAVCRKKLDQTGAYLQCRDAEGRYHDEVITTYLRATSPG